MSSLINVFVAGHNGMVGSAIIRQLEKDKRYNLITRARSQLDLLSQADVAQFFSENSINQVYLAAAKVGGIHANDTYSADFIYENLMIESNIIHSAHASGVEQLLFLGSSCIYPKMAEQPIKESSLLTGYLEPTNEAYAIAKIAGIKLCESYNKQYGRDYRSVMPTNLYGIHDNFHPTNSHVIPGLLRRFHEAKINNDSKVTAWGTGNAMREFLYIDDMASACIHVMNLSKGSYIANTEPTCSHLNIGTGVDVTIKELVTTIALVVGFEGEIEWDTTKPDGTPRKLLDTSKITRTGWQPRLQLKEGLKLTYEWFLNNQDDIRF